MLGCGVAGAISASFNAPIAGAIFAHEVIIGHFGLRAFAPIALASVSAVAVTRYHAFEYIAFEKIEDFVGYSIPVVEDAESMRIVGVVHESDFIRSYRAKISQARDESQ